MRTILFVGDLNAYSRSYQRYVALKELGYQVIGIPTFKPEQRGYGTKSSLYHRVRRKLGLPIDSTQANHKIVNLAVSGAHYDIIWIEKGLSIRPKTLSYAKEHQPQSLIALYSNDNMSKRHNSSFFYYKNTKIADVVYIAEEYSEQDLYRMGARRVVKFPRGYDRNSITPRPTGVPFANDVVFIGSFERERFDYLKSLSRCGVSTLVYGNGWPSGVKLKGLKIQYRPLYQKEFLETMHCSRIVLNFLRKMNNDVVTGRTFEIPGSGSFMLAEYSEAQTHYFVEGKEVEFFRSSNELVDKTLYYLSHSSEREAIARNGLIRCQSDGYSYHDRLRKMLAAIDC